MIVIGAGPAGSATAMSLARFPKVEVQLVERANFPRKKACGSGLSPWCLELLDGMGLLPAVAREAYHIGAARIGGPHGPVLELRSKYEAKVLCRTRLDQLLAHEAVRRGATLCEGTGVREIVRNGDDLIGLRTTDGELEADAVVVANGATSRLASEPRPVATLQTYMAWYEGVEDVIDAVELYFDRVVRPYYGWLFPESKTRVNIGIVFRPQPGAPNAKERFESFLAERMAPRMRYATRVDRPIGHPVAVSHRPTRLSQPGLLVAGEAGGLVDPATAEGIHHALASGWSAGELLGELAEAGQPFSAANLHPYTGRVREQIGRRLFAGQCLMQFARTPLFGWMIRFGTLSPVRRLLTWTLAGA